MTKIIACILYEEGRTVEPDLAIKSVEPYVDEIIIVDGSNEYEDSRSEILQKIWTDEMNQKGTKIKTIYQEYDHDDPGANGKQRNAYLEYCKKNHMEDWCLVLDSDECVTGMEALKEIAQKENFKCYDIHMEHFVNSLGKVDATVEEHFVKRRFFKIMDGIKYPEQEHTMPKGFNDGTDRTSRATIWHLGYAENLWKLKDKFLNHTKNSNMHTQQYLQNWYAQHAVGQYPTKQFDLNKIPEVILEYFDLEFLKDMLYYQGRDNLEQKHYDMTMQWNRHFEPAEVIDVGCGMGHFLNVWDKLGVVTYGFDISEYAIKNTPHKNIKIEWNNIAASKGYDGKMIDLVTCIDVLEHLEYDKLDVAIKNLKDMGHKILVSIPFKGDPNLEADPTHIIKEDRTWWIEHFTKNGLIFESVPDDFLFKDQLLILRHPI